MSQTLFPGYPVTIDLKVAWGDMDAFGHVNNTKFFRYFESARIAYFEKCNFMRSAVSHVIAPILATADCKFIRPLYYPDDILAGARVSRISEDRFEMQYGVYSMSQKTLAAIGTGMIVTFNYKEKHKEAVPEHWLKAILDLEQKTMSQLSGSHPDQ